MATLSGSLDFNTSYRYCSWHGKNEGNSLYVPYFHPSGSIKMDLSYSVTRDNETDNTLHWTISYGGTIYGGYGYKLDIYINVDGVDRSFRLVDGNGYSSYDTVETGSFSFDTTNTGSTATISLTAYCSEGCNHDYSDGISWRGGDRSSDSREVSVPAYQNWTAPTGASNVSASPSNIKPDGTVTVSWTAAHGGTNSPVTFYTLNYSKNETARVAYDSNVDINLTSKTVNLSNIGVVPGDKLVFDIDTWCTNIDGHGNGGWVGPSYSGEVVVYKDGCIYYKNSSGQKIECNIAYYKNSNGDKINNRYIKVKDGSGTTHVIDVL